MHKRLFSIFTPPDREAIPKGLGVSDLAFYRGETHFKSSDFKNIVNDIFLPKIQELGFKGKDFTYVRENSIYTEVVFFWTFKYGGAIGVDLLIKFKNIHYPDHKKNLKAREIRSTNAEFHQRLSPNGELNKQGQNIWFWVFENTVGRNNRIVEDIWRVFSIRGVEYFNNFKDHKAYIEQITTNNYKSFPDFHLTNLVGRHEKGTIYFLFEYWRQSGEITKALEFAKLGLTALKNEKDCPFSTIFKKYLEDN